MTLTLCVGTLFSSVATAGSESVEELCSNFSDTSLSMKKGMLKTPQYIEFYLRFMSEEITKKDTVKRMTEQLYFVKNRIHLSDTDLRVASVNRCLSSFK